MGGSEEREKTLSIIRHVAVDKWRNGRTAELD